MARISVDEIKLSIEPYFKESGLSGDEWKTKVVAKFYHKGILLHETMLGRDIPTALLLLGKEYLNLDNDLSIPTGPLEETLNFIASNRACDQEGCRNPASRYFHLQTDGDVTELKYCNKHSDRGNANPKDNNAVLIKT
jgi:hypothetical protein